MLAVPIQPGPPLTAGAAQAVFEGEFLPPQTGWRPYDVGPDGRFVIIRNSGNGESSAPAPLVVVQHWAEELKRIVGGDKSFGSFDGPLILRTSLLAAMAVSAPPAICLY